MVAAEEADQLVLEVDPQLEDPIREVVGLLQAHDDSITAPVKISRPSLVRRLLNWVSVRAPTQEEAFGERDVMTANTKRAIGILEQEAAKNNEDALYMLGQIRLFGNYSCKRDYAKSAELFSKLADNGNASAQHYLAFLYSNGLGNVQRNQGLAILYHTFAAENGHVASAMACGYRHLMGIGVPMNCETAGSYYRAVAAKAIEYYRSGPPGGMYLPRSSMRLADEEGGVFGSGASQMVPVAANAHNRRHIGLDSSKSPEDIVEFLRYMADKGDVAAQFNLARLYYDGSRAMTRNFARAIHYFGTIARGRWARDGRVLTSAPPVANAYAAKAAGYLGRMHLRGEGVDASAERSYLWFRRGAEMGDMMSQNGLGDIYLKGIPGADVRQSPVKAFEYFRAAAEQDFAPAQVSLAKMFLEQGDIPMAVRFFELATRHGHIEAWYYLAEIHREGIGREKNCGLATSYYKIVAERAETLISTLPEANVAYARGDYQLAHLCYMIAAEQGFEVAQVNVAYLLDTTLSRLRLLFDKQVTQDSKKEEMSFVFWSRSANQANVDSMVKVGDYYLAGVGIQADAKSAYEQYQHAGNFYSPLALWNIGW